MPTLLTADNFGRASFVAMLNDDVTGYIAGVDHPIAFKFTCTREEPVHEEHIRTERN
jgi:hypothetical protein